MDPAIKKLSLYFFLAMIILTPGKGFCQDEIRVIDVPTTHHTNLYIAIEEGIFAKHGLKVSYQKAQTPDLARDAVAFAKADIVFSCPTFAMMYIARGARVRVIAQGKIPCTSILVVPAGSAIKQVSDLDGKRVAGLIPTCEAVIAFSKAINDLGKRFYLVKLGPAEAMAALESGVVDAAILEEPYASIMELKGYELKFREVVDVPCRFISANMDFLQQHPEAAREFVAAIEEANAIFNKDPQADEIIKIAQKYTGAPIEAIRQGNSRIHLTTKLDKERNNKLQEMLLRIGVIKKALEDNELYAEQLKGITW